MRRVFSTLVVILAVVAAMGCGDSREKGKNKELDRPTSANEKK